MTQKSSLIMPRRTMLKLSGAAMATLATPAIISPARAADRITVFSWETYHLEPWLKEWTAKTGIEVDIVLTGSADEMYARTVAGSIEADVLVVDTGNLKRYVERGMMAPLDLAKIPNLPHVAAGFNFQQRNAIGGKIYGIPYNWGGSPIIYARSIGEEGLGSYDVMWDKRFAGKVSLYDDGYATFPMVAMKAGAQDPYNLSEDEFSAVIEAFRELRPQVGAIARGPSDQTAHFAAGDALIGYCMVVNSVFTLNADGKNQFDYVFPAAGSLGWIDNLTITPRGQREASYQFISDVLAPEWQARFIASAQTNGVLTSAAARQAGLSEDVLRKTTILDQDKPGFWENLSIFSEPEDIERRIQIWNDFKAGTL